MYKYHIYKYMRKIFSIAYKQDYNKGYAIGLNPFLEYNSNMQNDACIAGFNAGRSDYERMNGFIRDGIPSRVVTEKVLEDFLIAGLLGLPIDDSGYTSYQLGIIAEWYQSGTEKYEPDYSVSLLNVLDSIGIEMG